MFEKCQRHKKRLTLEFLLDYRLTPYPPSKSSENTAIQQGLMCHKTQDPCQRYRCQYFITDVPKKCFALKMDHLLHL